MKHTKSIFTLVAVAVSVLSFGGCATPARPAAPGVTSVPSSLPPYPPPPSSPVPTWTPFAPLPPTGSPPAPLPTLDPSRVTWVPTRTPDPQATQTPTPKPFVMPTVSWTIMTPSATWTTYREPDLGFSFQYPSDWLLEAPTTSRPPEQVATMGTGISLRNFIVGGVPKGNSVPPDAVTISIHAFRELEQYGTVENWITQRAQSAPGTTYSPSQQIKVGGIPALRWIATQQSNPIDITSIVIVLGKEKWIYKVDVWPATSTHISAFERLISTLQIP